VERDGRGRAGRVEGALQGGAGGVGLAVEEPAADLMAAGQPGDRPRPGEDLQGQLLPPVGREVLGGGRPRGSARARSGLRGGAGGRSLTRHVCSLRVMALVWNPALAWGEQAVEKSADRPWEGEPTVNQ